MVRKNDVTVIRLDMILRCPLRKSLRTLDGLQVVNALQVLVTFSISSH